MTTQPTASVQRPGRLRRAWEWVWLSERARELVARRPTRADSKALAVARGCQRLAWRTLGGLEPLPAETRAEVARPLVVAGLNRCLPTLEPRVGSLSELFAEPVWRERLIHGGVPEKDLERVADWLLGESGDANPSTPELGFQALTSVLEHLEHEGGALRRLRWRRTGLIAALLSLFATAAWALVVLLIPRPGPDIGVGKMWQASSAYPGYAAGGIKQQIPSSSAFFCTNEEVEPWWMIDLKRATVIDSVTVLNRADCCTERAPPLAVEVSADKKKWREVARMNDSFRSWYPSFEPTKARYVRVRSLRRTFLHLQDVRVHAADD